MLHINDSEILKSIYFAYFHSIMKYGIILGVTHLIAKRYSLYKKKNIRLMAVVKPRNSCTNLFKRLEILTLP
jgi:hypothetical protein